MYLDALCVGGRCLNEVCTLQEMAMGQADTVPSIGCSCNELYANKPNSAKSVQRWSCIGLGLGNQNRTRRIASSRCASIGSLFKIDRALMKKFHGAATASTLKTPGQA